MDEALTASLFIAVVLGDRLALAFVTPLRATLRVAGLMVPLQVVFAAVTALTPGLAAEKVAHALVDALDVGLEVVGPGESCEGQSHTLLDDRIAHLLRLQPS